MTGLLIKVEHEPQNVDFPWYASMYRDGPGYTEFISGMGAWAETREDAIAKCKALYEASLEAQPVEWLAYEPEVPEPQSIKAV